MKSEIGIIVGRLYTGRMGPIKGVMAVDGLKVTTIVVEQCEGVSHQDPVNTIKTRYISQFRRWVVDFAD